VKLSKKLRGQAGGQPKIWGTMAHPRPPLRTAIVQIKTFVPDAVLDRFEVEEY